MNCCQICNFNVLIFCRGEILLRYISVVRPAERSCRLLLLQVKTPRCPLECCSGRDPRSNLRIRAPEHLGVATSLLSLSSRRSGVTHRSVVLCTGIRSSCSGRPQPQRYATAERDRSSPDHALRPPGASNS